MRALRISIFKVGFFTNFWINIAFGAAIVLQFAVVKNPFLRSLFGFEEFPVLDFLVMMLISTVIIWAGELYKYLRFKKGLF
jgi:Ca2+-transporting ATPase